MRTATSCSKLNHPETFFNRTFSVLYHFPSFPSLPSVLYQSSSFSSFPSVLFFLLFSVAFFFTFPVPAAEHWTDSAEFGPFVARANFSLKRMQPLFGQLEELQNNLVRHLDIPPAEEKIELLLFRDEWTYRSYLRRNLPHIPYRRALYVKQHGRATVLVHWSRDFQVDTRHECTHALLHAVLPMVPLWLDEGLAEYYEMPPSGRANGSPHAKKLTWNLMSGGIADLSQLERLTDFRTMSETDYRDCWAWAHFMLHGPPEVHDELVRFLADIAAGKYPELMSKRLPLRIPQPTVRCINHHRGWRCK